jgi:two-component system sensor histidine kinase UhpB
MLLSLVMNTISYLRQKLFSVSIFQRVLIGNSIVIIIGAIGGTLLTRHLAMLGNINLILLFSSVGIILTLMVNYWIIKTALHPLQELRLAVAQLKDRQTPLRESIVMHADPVISQLVVTIDSMLERLDKRTLQLRALSERDINAQEEERRRIARALHDDTSQSVSMLIIQLERLENTLPMDQGDLHARLTGIRQLAMTLLEDLRKNIWDLRPTILDDLGLVPAIRWYARFKLKEVGISVEFEMFNEATRLRPHLETMLFRITQEAVNNILRHADAENVMIRLQQENDQICLEIEDDGRGFDVGTTAGQAVSRKQLGLLGIQERASLVGGEVQIASSPGLGTRVRVYVPLLRGNSIGKADTELHQDEPEVKNEAKDQDSDR